MEARKNAMRLLEPGKTIFLVTAGEDGLPDARAMAPVQCDGDKTVWMLTGKCSDKYRQLSKDPRCLIYATDFDDTEEYHEIRLWGAVEILDDADSRASAWVDDYACYFPAGKDDPNLCVLKFTAASGTVQTRTAKDRFAL